MSIEEHKKRIAELEEQKERLEAEISHRSAEFRAGSQPVKIESIQAAIPANAALIEFAVYRPFDPKAESNTEAYKEPHYIAYVLRQKGEVRWKDLGDAKGMENSVEKLREALRDPDRKDVRQLARALDEKIMRPIRPLIDGASRLLISPDGSLNLVPFETLVDEQNHYLVERFSCTYLSSGRDLLRIQVMRDSKSNPLLLANPRFGEPAEWIAQANSSAHKKRQSVTSSSDLSKVYFAPLSGTAQEAQAIRALLVDARILTGQEATESLLKQAAAPRILHVATHGFFLTDGSSGKSKIENPLLRSGLALAGANLRKNTGDDGILTALEASGLNLWGTKLVTLSACDTCLGEVKNGEGVYGLRRAFVLAGTETLVMSLWPVSDYVTRQMMTSYYKGLKQGFGRGEALRQVQLSMLKRKDRRHPFYWASFIQSGEWANLNGKR
jgi:CHAT domain-containing protein